jgi:hypothetical protein
LRRAAAAFWGVGCLKTPRPRQVGCDRPAVHQISLRSGRPAGCRRGAADVRLGAADAGRSGDELAVGSGAIWVVQPADNQEPGPPQRSGERRPGVLQRIDVATRQPAIVRQVPRLPADLVVDNHGAWVTDGLNRTLIAIPR